MLTDSHCISFLLLLMALTECIPSCSRASLQQRLALNEARRKNIDQQLLEMQQSVVS